MLLTTATGATGGVMNPKRFTWPIISIFFLAVVGGAIIVSEIRGSVLDPHGDSVNGAKVLLRALGSDYLRAEKTNDDGEFIFTAVQIGEYAVTVEAEGFTFSLGDHTDRLAYYASL